VIWRVIKILFRMLRVLFQYIWVVPKSSEVKERFLRGAFVDWSRYALKTFNAGLTVLGREHLPPPEGPPRIFMSNHQSQLDIPSLVFSIQETVGFVAKKELGRFPLLSFWMRQVGCVFIDRSDKSGARKSLENAAAKIGRNPMVIFPEGTRSKTGQLLPLKLGGLRMAVLAGARIIPVHIHNTRKACEARTAGAPEPIPISLRFFPPMDAHGLKDEKSSWIKARDYVEECWRIGERDSQALSA